MRVTIPSQAPFDARDIGDRHSAVCRLVQQKNCTGHTGSCLGEWSSGKEVSSDPVIGQHRSGSWKMLSYECRWRQTFRVVHGIHFKASAAVFGRQDPASRFIALPDGNTCSGYSARVPRASVYTRQRSCPGTGPAAGTEQPTARSMANACSRMPVNERR
jgi:hypothetical protein